MRPFSDVDLHALVDNQLSAERRAVITAYLKTAPADAARVDMWRRQNEAIRAVFAGAESEPLPLWLTIGHLTSAQPDKSPTLDRTWTRRGAAQPALRRRADKLGLHRNWKPVAIALLAFAAGIAVPLVAPQMTGVQDWWAPEAARAAVLQTFSRRALEAHLTYSLDADRPVELAEGAEGSLSRWFKHRLPFPVRIPDLQRVGWTLLGGRVAPGTLGPAALLVYENAAGERLSLYVGRVANPSLADTAYEITPDHVLAWIDGPIGFAMTTSKPAAWLAANAHDLYRATYGIAAG